MIKYLHVAYQKKIKYLNVETNE